MSAALIVAAIVLVSCAREQNAVANMAALTAEVAQLKSELTYLSDRQQIHDAQLRYIRGLDRHDADLLKSAFWPDAEINYPSMSPPNSPEDYTANLLANFAKLTTYHGHLVNNETMEIQGDVAHVETYLTEFSTFKNGESRIVAGRYIDRFDRRNGQWRIALREFIPHFFTESDVAFGTDFKWPPTACREGTWDKHDISYRRPLTVRTQHNSGPGCIE